MGVCIIHTVKKLYLYMKTPAGNQFLLESCLPLCGNKHALRWKFLCPFVNNPQKVKT